MNTTNFSWKVWLKLNLLTKDVDNDYIAEVSTTGSTKHNEDIAREIGEEGSEIKYDTLLSILNRRDRIVRRMLQKGNSVMDGCLHIMPRVQGVWLGAGAQFDAAVHKITVDVVPSKDLREALTQVGVEVLGVKGSGAFIGLVTDAATGLTDGSITAGDDILIEGDKLKIIPEGESELGVFFIDTAGKSIAVTHRLTENKPKKLIARVPALPAGEYTLRIITRFAAGANILKEPRIINYHKTLVIS
ncbi:MAG: DUF4469 domain-containing protein [Prevotellaceae bacterium]|jgi:hypothetical protein|nr:DUF4469 domain-containing protein [Prevotellaceae bacterium]